MAAKQRLLEPRGAGELRAVGQHGRSVNDHANILDAPLANPVVVFQREAQWIHPPVAGSTDRVGTVLLHLLADSK